ncbi:MAG TPA: homocysteine S-methyltransferase [Acidobacteriaceae bacterium]|nr:homocysteine S-methyltransferase [Acidobacteriaceae bacterium]
MIAHDQLRLTDARVLDGGMASELEFLGADISGPLWSAHVLEGAPERVQAVHRAYVEAGADVLLTASYQVSRKGYVEVGLLQEDADKALLRAVDLAESVRHEARKPDVLIAASLGPYGAALHNGSEYHGNYDCTFTELVEFHRERIAVLAQSSADLLAFETIPSLEEARAIARALEPWPQLSAWMSFACPDPHGAALEVAHGESLFDCAAFANTVPQVVAIGVNCTQPRWIAALIAELKRASSKPIVVYPNSGEGWDAANRCWTGVSDPANFGSMASEWFEAGAKIIGGCCRTRPEHIRQVAAARHALSLTR